MDTQRDPSGELGTRARVFATLSLKIPLRMRTLLKIRAAQRGLTMTDLLVELISQLEDERAGEMKQNSGTRSD